MRWTHHIPLRNVRSGGSTLLTRIHKFYKRGQRKIWLIDANATVGSRQSSAIGSMNAEQESANGEWFHNVLLKFDMALPVTFQLNSSEAGTWCSTAGHWKRYDFVAISRAWLPSVQTAGVEPKVHVDINMKVDHKPTVATLHLPVEQQVMPHGKVTGQMRVALRLPEIREALQKDFARYPVPHPSMPVEEHDRLVSKLFRAMRARHCGMPKRVPNGSWVTTEVWAQLCTHAHIRVAFTSSRKLLVVAVKKSCFCAWDALCGSEPRQAAAAVLRQIANTCHLLNLQIAWQAKLLRHVSRATRHNCRKVRKAVRKSLRKQLTTGTQRRCGNSHGHCV